VSSVIARVTAAALASALLCAAAPRVAAAQKGDPLTAWAAAQIRRSDGGFAFRPTATTTVYDHFGPTQYFTRSLATGRWLAGDGPRLGTAGSGSFWVYDPVHHIAAASEQGDVDGDRIMYSAPPPGTLPRRNLAGIVSVHGLRLGLTTGSVLRILRVPSSAIRRISPHESVIYARAGRKCGRLECSHDHIIVFTDGRASSISLADIGA
jgi:hypothetical protein